MTLLSKKTSSIFFFTRFQLNKNEPWSQLTILIQMDEVLKLIGQFQKSQRLIFAL